MEKFFENFLRNICILSIMFIILHTNSSIIGGNAMRPLNEYKEWLRGFESPLLLESLPRGPVPPSTSSPCTYIPGEGNGSCP